MALFVACLLVVIIYLRTSKQAEIAEPIPQLPESQTKFENATLEQAKKHGYTPKSRQEKICFETTKHFDGERGVFKKPVKSIKTTGPEVLICDTVRGDGTSASLIFKVEKDGTYGLMDVFGYCQDSCPEILTYHAEFKDKELRVDTSFVGLHVATATLQCDELRCYTKGLRCLLDQIPKDFTPKEGTPPWALAVIQAIKGDKNISKKILAESDLVTGEIEDAFNRRQSALLIRGLQRTGCLKDPK